ncbi:hypothetical protein OKF32_01350 [Lentilactobacillus buchneri]|nr:hypothetical protein OKF32_01350 [Lentilactobacillus sp. Egmn17]
MRAKQQEIIDALKVKPTIDPKAEIRRSVDFLKDYLKKFSFLKTLVLGISGGQDSTLAGKLAQLAISELRSLLLTPRWLQLRQTISKSLILIRVISKPVNG